MGEGVPPRGVRFPTQNKGGGAGAHGADASTEGIQKSPHGAIALLLADLGRREHRQPEMRPKPSTTQGRSTALRAATAPPRPAKGAPKGKVMGNLATRPGVRRNHPRRRYSPSPTAFATQAGFLVLKFLGEKKTGGVFSTGISPGRKNGMNNILGLVSDSLSEPASAIEPCGEISPPRPALSQYESLF